MITCVYCPRDAIGEDAIGLDACEYHLRAADAHFENATGRQPNTDTFLSCDVHSDSWRPGCSRCETCCQHHYGMSVQQMAERMDT